MCWIILFWIILINNNLWCNYYFVINFWILFNKIGNLVYLLWVIKCFFDERIISFVFIFLVNFCVVLVGIILLFVVVIIICDGIKFFIFLILSVIFINFWSFFVCFFMGFLFINFEISIVFFIFIFFLSIYSNDVI